MSGQISQFPFLLIFRTDRNMKQGKQTPKKMTSPTFWPAGLSIFLIAPFYFLLSLLQSKPASSQQTTVASAAMSPTSTGPSPRWRYRTADEHWVFSEPSWGGTLDSLGNGGFGNILGNQSRRKRAFNALLLTELTVLLRHLRGTCPTFLRASRLGHQRAFEQRR